MTWIIFKLSSWNTLTSSNHFVSVMERRHQTFIRDTKMVTWRHVNCTTLTPRRYFNAFNKFTRFASLAVRYHSWVRKVCFLYYQTCITKYMQPLVFDWIYQRLLLFGTQESAVIEAALSVAASPLTCRSTINNLLWLSHTSTHTHTHTYNLLDMMNESGPIF